MRIRATSSLAFAQNSDGLIFPRPGFKAIFQVTTDVYGGTRLNFSLVDAFLIRKLRAVLGAEHCFTFLTAGNHKKIAWKFIGLGDIEVC